MDPRIRAAGARVGYERPLDAPLLFPYAGLRRPGTRNLLIRFCSWICFILESPIKAEDCASRPRDVPNQAPARAPRSSSFLLPPPLYSARFPLVVGVHPFVFLFGKHHSSISRSRRPQSALLSLLLPSLSLDPAASPPATMRTSTTFAVLLSLSVPSLVLATPSHDGGSIQALLDRYTARMGKAVPVNTIPEDLKTNSTTPLGTANVSRVVVVKNVNETGAFFRSGLLFSGRRRG
jgi:hypothetical protein